MGSLKEYLFHSGAFKQIREDFLQLNHYKITDKDIQFLKQYALKIFDLIKDNNYTIYSPAQLKQASYQFIWDLFDLYYTFKKEHKIKLFENILKKICDDKNIKQKLYYFQDIFFIYHELQLSVYQLYQFVMKTIPQQLQGFASLLKIRRNKRIVNILSFNELWKLYIYWYVFNKNAPSEIKQKSSDLFTFYAEHCDKIFDIKTDINLKIDDIIDRIINYYEWYKLTGVINID